MYEGSDLMYIEGQINNAPGDSIEFLELANIHTINLVETSFSLRGDHRNERLEGVEQGGGNQDKMYGEGGDDILLGFSGNDVLDGGSGNDVLVGGFGEDLYITGEGNDVVDEASAGESGVVDTVMLWDGSKASNILIERKGNDVLIHSLAEGSLGSRVTIRHHMLSADEVNPNSIETVKLSDGSTVDLEAQTKYITGSSGGDSLSSTSPTTVINEIFSGLAGNDIISAGRGNDIIDGGLGDDILQGQDGHDLYIASGGYDIVREVDNYTSSHDLDIVRLWEDVPAEFVGMMRDGQDLLIFRRGYDDSIRVEDQFNIPNGINRLVETIQTFDGEKILFREQSYVSKGTSGNDNLGGLTFGALPNDSLFGLEGNDSLIGDTGDDRLDGGDGSDLLSGMDGNDLYIASAGIDIVREADNVLSSRDMDRVELWEEVGEDDISLARRGSDLIITNAIDGSSLVLERQFNWNTDFRYWIEDVALFDGTLIDIRNRSYTSTGTAAGDTLTGVTSGALLDDKLLGLGGNDSLSGGDGDDTLDGGTGNDELSGGAGDDSFIASAGQDIFSDLSGSDSLQIWDGAVASDLHLYRSGVDLVIERLGTSDTIRIEDQFQGQYGIETLVFDDGSEVELQEQTYTAYGTSGHDTIRGIGAGGSPDDTIYGLAGNDTLYGGSGDDFIVGGLGSDRIELGDGDDTVMFGRGDGTDTLASATEGRSGHDIALFGADISHEQLWFSLSGSDLLVRVIGSNDTLRVLSWTQLSGAIDEFRSGDGKSLMASNVAQLVQAMAAFSPPPVGQMTLSQEVRDQLAPTLAASWSTTAA